MAASGSQMYIYIERERMSENIKKKNNYLSINLPKVNKVPLSNKNVLESVSLHTDVTNDW